MGIMFILLWINWRILRITEELLHVNKVILDVSKDILRVNEDIFSVSKDIYISADETKNNLSVMKSAFPRKFREVERG